jgi:aryl-alcohol dehydrogenase-like predicted oxidoreductase
VATPSKRPLGATGLDISPIGIGAWAFGGQWGPAADTASVATIHRALELGANWIDTAPSYGHGRSEQVVARAIQGLAEPPFVFTKCGVHFDANGGFGSCLEPAAIRAEAEHSITRLNVEAIDLYQIHWGQPDSDVEAAWATLVELRDEGTVRHIGVSNFTPEQVNRCTAIAPVETIQPPYSMLSRTDLWTAPYVGNVPRDDINERLLPHCIAYDIGVVTFSPLASGLLSSRLSAGRIASLPADDWRTEEPDFRPANIARIAPLVEALGTLGTRIGATVEQLALAWVLTVPGITGAIAGMRTPKQAEALMAAADLDTPHDLLAEIDHLLAVHNSAAEPTPEETTP